MNRLRVIDTGLRDARTNIAMGLAIARSVSRGDQPETLRFFRFPPAVLIGRHQHLAAEVDLAAAEGLDLARRLTGGGAVYVDPTQLCWEVVLREPKPVLDAVAKSLGPLGVATTAEGNDITVEGRKICGTAGFREGAVHLVQGTLLADGDLDRMVQVLTPPPGKLARHGVPSVARRVTTLKALLGAAPSFDTLRACITAGVAGLGYAPCSDILSEAEEAETAYLRAPDHFVHSGDDDAH